MTFRAALGRTPNLGTAWRAGLGALRSQDRPHIRAEIPRHLTGSADVDAALVGVQPNANRWDFAIGYQHSNRKQELIYWVETHTGSDSQIAVVLRKFDWLKNWLRGDGQELAKFERDIVWVASGATSFTQNSTQRKRLATSGLRYVGKILHIPEERSITSD